MKVYEENDPKTKDFLAKIGETVVLFGHLDSMVDLIIWELLSPSGKADERQNIGRLVTAPLDYMQKVDFLRSLIVHRKGEDQGTEFKKTYTALKEAAEIRNDIAHSVWFIQFGNLEQGIELDTSKINVKKAFERGKLFDFSKAHSKISLEELQSQIDKIQEANNLLLKFIFII